MECRHANRGFGNEAGACVLSSKVEMYKAELSVQVPLENNFKVLYMNLCS